MRRIPAWFMTWRWVVWMLVALGASSTLLAGSALHDDVRQQFKSAWQQVSRAAPDPRSIQSQSALETYSDSAALREYVLYPYLQAARWQRQLTRISSESDWAQLDRQITAFLGKEGMAPVTRELRRQWLISLATRQQWQTVLRFYPADNTDADLKCQWFNAQIQLNQAPDSAALRTLYLNATRLPMSCNAVFEWARAREWLTTEWLQTRLKLVFKAGNTELARDLLAQLPTDAQRPWQTMLALLDKPQLTIDQLLVQPQRVVDAELWLDAWQRFARRDVDAALKRYPALINARPEWMAAQSRMALEIALALSWNRRAEALDYFDRVKAADMTELGYEWYARAALWAGDWARARSIIQSMPGSLSGQARWRYWLARCQDELKEVAAAQAGYRALIDKEDNYYAAMAAARAQQPYQPHAVNDVPDKAAQERIAQSLVVQRARELLAVNLRDAAEQEWLSAWPAWSREDKLSAAQLAHQWGWYDQAIASYARSARYDNYGLLYPMPYESEVNAAAKRSGVDKDLIYAVMRQETLFRADAKSSANARGLMQLLPATAQQVARRTGLPSPSAEGLYEPGINVPLGAAYLRSLIDRFAGQVPLALAAYNAGPAAVARWLPARALALDVWLENVPFNETRTYVQRIYWHRLVFMWLQSNQPVDVAPWLQPIRP